MANCRNVCMRRSAIPARECGFVMIAFALALLLILGSVGLTVDLGRMYITKNEAQSFADSAAIAAAMQLNGKTWGVSKAKAAALATVKGWEFGTKPFDGTTSTITVSFGKSLADTFVETPSDPSGYSCARVVVRDVRLPMYFMPVLTNVFSSNIAAAATAKQIPEPGPGAGRFSPFSPFAHPIMETLSSNPAATPAPTYQDDPFNLLSAEIPNAEPPNNLRSGGLYTLLWPNNAQVQNNFYHGGGNPPVCPDDHYEGIASLKVTSAKTAEDATGNSSRGYLYNSGSDLADTVVADIVPDPSKYPPIEVGDEVYTDYLAVSSGAVHSTIINRLVDRVLQDDDHESSTYKEYVESGKGNGRRVIIVPINAGPSCAVEGAITSDKGFLYTGTNTCKFPDPNDPPRTITYGSYDVIGFARFFLLRDQYYKSLGGNDAACAEYIGPGAVEGGNGPGAGPGTYFVRLIQ